MMLSFNTIKICSLRRPEHAEWVVEAAADMFGLIFSESRRQVTVTDAKAIVDHASTLASSGRLASVGVFVDQSAEEVNRIADLVGLDAVQHHRPALLANGGRIERPLLVAFRTAPGVSAGMILEEATSIAGAGNNLAGILIDGYAAGVHGGAGVAANWDISAEVAREFPVMLAGGLRPENVASSIEAVRPAGVDVSSGVETNGEKDLDKILSYVRAARAGFSGLIRNMDNVPLGQSAEPVQRPQSLG